MQRTRNLAFTVFPKAAAFLQPIEYPFNDPTLRNNCESMRFITFATSTSAPIIAFTALANFSPVYPPSTKAFIVIGKLGLLTRRFPMHHHGQSRSQLSHVWHVSTIGNYTDTYLYYRSFFQNRSLFLQLNLCYLRFLSLRCSLVFRLLDL